MIYIFTCIHHISYKTPRGLNNQKKTIQRIHFRRQWQVTPLLYLKHLPPHIFPLLLPFPIPTLPINCQLNLHPPISRCGRQFLPTGRGFGLAHHIEGDEVIPERLLGNNQSNPVYNSWVRVDQLILSWIFASISVGILPQLVVLKLLDKHGLSL